MHILIRRKWFSKESTISTLSVDGLPYCYTLEDVVREESAEKVYGKTAIPYGTYKVIIDFSNHFKKLLPHVLNVPGFEGIRIHSGNTAEDTEGCILVGLSKGTNTVYESRKGFALLYTKIEEAVERYEDITLEIIKDGNSEIA
jgi:hypothetical protein